MKIQLFLATLAIVIAGLTAGCVTNKTPAPAPAMSSTTSTSEETHAMPGSMPSGTSTTTTVAQ